MASTQAQELVYNLVFDFQDKVFQTFDASISGVIGNLTKMGTAAVAVNTAMYAVANGVSKETIELRNLARELGMTEAAYKSFQLASAEEGVGKGSVDSTLKSLATAREQMLLGGGDTLAWGQLGINPTQFKNTKDLLMAVQKSISKIGDDQKSINIMERLGISAEMLPILSKSNAELKKSIAFYEAVGATQTKAQIQVAEQYNKSAHKVTAIYDGLRNRLGDLFMKHLTPALEDFATWWETNGKLIQKIINGIVKVVSKFSKIMLAIFSRLAQTALNFVSLMGGLENTLYGIALAFVAIKGKAIASFLAMIAPALLLYIAIDDLFALLSGKDSFIGNLFGIDPKSMKDLNIMGKIFDAINISMQFMVESWEKIFGWISELATIYNKWSADQSKVSETYFGNFGGGAIGEHRAEQGLTPTGGNVIPISVHITDRTEGGIDYKMGNQYKAKGFR